MFKTINDIENTYNFKFNYAYIKYNSIILDIFNILYNNNYDTILDKINSIIELDNNNILYNIIGLYHYYSTKNYDEMEKYYKLASNKGNIKSMYNLGHYYQYITKNYIEMKKYYKMAIAKGDVDSINNLGIYHYNITKNYTKMIKYYMQAIDKSNALAMYNLGYYHQYITKNYTEMEKYYKMASEHGYIDSLSTLGYFHEYIIYNYESMIDYYCTYFKTVNNINKNIINTKYYLDIYCNLDKINRTKLDKTNKIYEFEERLQSHLSKINNLKNINSSHISQSTNNLFDSTNNTHEQNISINTNELTTCNICLESCDELISWDCHISHIVCNKCYPHIHRDGKCHMCRSNI